MARFFESVFGQLLIRLIITAVVQISIVFLLINQDPQSPIGFLLLALPFTIPLVTLANWGIIVLIEKMQARTTSRILHFLIPLFTIFILFILLVGLSLLPLGANYILLIIVGLLAFPLLILEIIVKYLWLLFGQKKTL